MASVSIAAGVDYLTIEVYLDPEKSFSDRQRQLSIKQFQNLYDMLKIANIT